LFASVALTTFDLMRPDIAAADPPRAASLFGPGSAPAGAPAARPPARRGRPGELEVARVARISAAMSTGAVARNALVGHAERFNHNIKVLVRDLARRFPKDPLIDRAHKRVATAVDLSPLFVIDLVGPYLFSYRSQILGGRPEDVDQFFAENTFDAEIRASVDQDRVDLVTYILPKAKECARGFPAEQKRQYLELVAEMLDDYLEYRVAAAPT